MEAQAVELASAIAQHQAGRLAHAEAGYRRLLAQNPNHVDALHLLGVLASQQGRLESAADLIGRALAQAGRHPLILFNLANVLKDQGHLVAAIEHYREVLSRDPRFVLAHVNLGDALCRQNQDDAAVPCFEHALQIDPGMADAHFRLGGALARLGRLDAARRHYEQALQLDPGNVAAANNLGTVCQDLGDLTAAAAAYEQALLAAPDCVEARFNLGSVCNKLRQYQAAETHFAGALALRPELAEGYAALADALHFQGRTEQATSQLLQAAQLCPNSLLRQLRPALLCPLVFQDNESITGYRLRVAARLSELSASARRLDCDLNELAASHCHPPVDWAYQGHDEQPLKSQFADLFAERWEPGTERAHQGLPHIGFVVTGGNEGVFLRGMAGVVQRLDPRRFRLSVACSPAAVARCRQEIRNPAVNFLPLPKLFPLAIDALRSARFDLLYYWEIGTDSLNYFLPFFRLAPVQCTSWGWPVTSGIPQVDYFISSSLLEPADGAAHYRETLVRLRYIPNYYESPPPHPAADRAMFGWTRAQHIYFCGQSPRKIQPDFDLLIGDILRADPKGIVALMSATLATVTEALQARLTRRIPDVAGRIQFLPRLSAATYRGATAAAHVVLDTLHYAGGANSIYDTAAAGTPLVTLAGRFHRGRYTAAVCGLLGLEECVAADADDYVRIAVRLAGDEDFRAAVQHKICERRDVLFSNGAAVHELAEFFEQAVAERRARR